METMGKMLEKTSLDSAAVETVDRSMIRKNSYASEVSRLQYLNIRTADVFFTFEGSKERVPAHKSVLAAASDVFDKMFYGSMAMNGDVPLPGKSPEAFKSFLQFCYLDEVVLKPDNITNVMSLLHEYQMDESLVVCGKILADNWTVEDICLVYDWAINFQMEELEAFCERQISAHIVEILKTDGFLSSSFNVIDRILSWDSLMCDESMVLGACLDWARHQCKQNGQDENDMKIMREYLTNHSSNENLLYKIRYGSVTQADFLMQMNANDGLFARVNEYEDAVRLLLGSTNSKTGIFQTKSRNPSWIDERAVEHLFQLKIHKEIKVQGPKCFVLKTNRTILFGGFYIVPLCNIKRKFYVFDYEPIIPVSVSIEEQRKGGYATKILTKLIYTKRTHVNCSISVGIINPEFIQLTPNPILMKPDCEYHVKFEFEASSFCSSNDVKSKQTILLGKNLNIQIRPENIAEPSIISGFKLIELN